EHSSRGGVWLAGHDLLDQFGERREAWGRGAVPDHVRAVHVVGGQVCQGAVSAGFGFHTHRLVTRPGRCALVDAAAGLHARLLIGAEDDVVFSHWLAVAPARVEI